MLFGRAQFIRQLKFSGSSVRQVKYTWWQSVRLNHQDGNAHYGSVEEEGCKLHYELYASHVPTTITQKVVLGIGSSVLGLLDPRRGGKILFTSLVILFCISFVICIYAMLWDTGSLRSYAP